MVTKQRRKGSSFKSNDDMYKQALKFCSRASGRLSKWDDLESYTSQLVQGRSGYTTSHPTDSNSSFKNPRSVNAPDDFDAAFYRAILHINRAEWDDAANCIDNARMAMDSRFTALLAESYKRAYPSMVAAQELSELEEIITYRQLEARLNKGKTHPAVTQARQHLLNVWRRRLDGCRIDAEVHSSILGVRSLVLTPTDEVDAIIKLSALSRQAESYLLAERVLLDPLVQMNCTLESRSFGVGIPPLTGIGLTTSLAKSMELIVNGEISVQMKYGPHHERLCADVIDEAGGKDRLIIQQKLYFAYIKHLWATERQDEAMSRMGKFCHIVDLTAKCGYYVGQSEAAHVSCFHVSCWLKCGDWRLALLPPGTDLDDNVATDVLVSYKRATEAVRGNNLSLYKAWHSWALINFRLAEQISSNEKDSEGTCLANKSPTAVKSHVIAAVKAFVRAISVGTKRLSASVQQDMLNLLSCLFKYGELPDVATTINDGLGSIKMEAWLGVLPQLLARIHIKSEAIRSVLHSLLVRLGMKHPQALMYPLSVLLKSPVVDRKNAAESLMVSLKAQSSALVEEALLVSSELIRVAILWLELWHEGLEDASRLYYGEGNVSGMLDVLIPLHAQLEKGASTRREQDFLKSFGRDLHEAYNHIKDYVRWITESGQSIPTQGGFISPNQSGRSGSPANAEAEAALNQAWDLYYTVFRRINKQLPGLTTLELNHCSPALFNARNLELGVPGSYRVDGSYIKIQRFITDVHVITSKQRPRKITIRGNDGKDYVFLLKG
jgi:FKBP12-rapamycin complex-associated protein